jgi:ribosomal-protein-alanine N-acetyltransferase
MLEIRETNLSAQLFFRDAGFRAISVLRSFYDDTPEDAYLMQYRYSAATAAEAAQEQAATRLAG